MNTVPQIPIDCIISVNDVKYTQHTDEIVTVGSLVLDTKDNTYGVIDMIMGDKVAIKDGYVTEVNVPMSRIRVLKPLNKEVS